MALVLLPCDLPTWPTVHHYFAQLKLAKNANQVVELMYKLHNLCCIGLDSDEDNYTDSQHFKVFHSFLETVLVDEERKQFFDVILPNLAESAVKLKSLKPANGLLYSLQQQAEQFNIDRRLIQSLLSHAFFSTFPKRSVKTHPTLQNFNFSEFFNHLDSLHQQAKLRSFLRYFENISTDEILSQGSVQFSRQVTPNWKNRSLEEWLTCDLPLCPLTVHHEGGIDDFKGDAVRVCFASPRIGGEVLTDGCNQEEINFCTCPELLVTLLFVEKLEENEVMIVRNFFRIGTIQDGKKFVNLDNPTCDNYLCLIDAENFEREPAIQYQESHIRRELFKAFSGVQQTMDSRRLSPLGESCTTPPPEMWYSVCGALEHDKSDDTAITMNISSQRRPTLIGQSFNSLVDNKSLNSPDEKKLMAPGLGSKGRLVSQESEADYKDAVSYPWHMQQSTIADGDDVWFTPMEPPKVSISQISAAEESTKVNRVFNKASIESILSDEEYQSCDEDENPGPSIPKIEAGPVASTGRVTLISQHPPLIKRNLSSQSDASRSVESQDSGGGSKNDEEDDQMSLHRVPSTGFLLDEEDYFVGDGLEAEQEWLRQFRNRSMSRSISGISRRNSSRYSFSSDFSSDLDDIYEHFEEMMAKGPVADDPQVAKYVGGILKRTLSDSLTAARQRCTEGEMMPRSLSLADHLTQERRSLERAKQVGICETAGEGVSADKSGKRKLSGNLVSIVIEQSLAEVEEKLAFEMHKDKADAIRKTLGNLYSQLSANNLPIKTDVNVDADDKREDVKVTSGNNSVVSLNIIAPDDDSDSSRSFKDESTGCRSIEDDDDSDYSADRRRSVSEPDLRFFTCDSALLPDDQSPDFLRKWDATSNLFDGGLLSPLSSTPKLTRPRSNSSAVRTQSLESLCTRFWDSGRNSDSDQFWLVFDTHQSSLEDVLSVGEEENPPRRRVKSFSSTTKPLICQGDLQTLKRTSSDPSLSPNSLSARVEEVENLMKRERDNPVIPVVGTGRTGILSDHFSPLQVITEVPHEEMATPDLCNKINFTGPFSTRDDENLVIRNDDSKSKTSDWNSTKDQRIETPVNIHGYKPVITGNWGCGRLKGNPQLKALIQWMAASRAEIPTLIYFTQRNQHVVKLDIINRILLDRHWTVGTLMKVLLNYCNQRVDDNSICLFDAILPRDSH